jgi:proteasome lid subunit RPN8/RPN11
MKNRIKEECSKRPTEESCGIIFFAKKAKVLPCYNWAEDKDISFKIHPKDYLRASKRGEIFGIYHSHITIDESFSEKDIRCAEELMLPYFVYSLKSDSHNLYIPESLKKREKSFKSFLYRMKKEYSVIDK